MDNISPFIGRLEDIGTDAYQLILELRNIIDLYGFETEIIAASIRNATHVEKVAGLGAHIEVCSIVWSLMVLRLVLLPMGHRVIKEIR